MQGIVLNKIGKVQAVKRAYEVYKRDNKVNYEEIDLLYKLIGDGHFNNLYHSTEYGIKLFLAEKLEDVEYDWFRLDKR